MTEINNTQRTSAYHVPSHSNSLPFLVSSWFPFDLLQSLEKWVIMSHLGYREWQRLRTHRESPRAELLRPAPVHLQLLAPPTYLREPGNRFIRTWRNQNTPWKSAPARPSSSASSFSRDSTCAFTRVVLRWSRSSRKQTEFHLVSGAALFRPECRHVFPVTALSAILGHFTDCRRR